MAGLPSLLPSVTAAVVQIRVPILFIQCLCFDKKGVFFPGVLGVFLNFDNERMHSAKNESAPPPGEIGTFKVEATITIYL